MLIIILKFQRREHIIGKARNKIQRFDAFLSSTK